MLFPLLLPAFSMLAIVHLHAQGQPAGLGPAPAPAPPMTLTSPTIKDLSFEVATKHTCADANAVSPALQWSNAPQNTVSFAIIVHDADGRRDRS